MPIEVVGSKNFTPTQEQINRIQDFYRWSGYQKLPNTIILVSPKDFDATSIALGRPRTDTAFTLAGAGRSYINASLLNSKSKTGKGNLEWTLAHEAAHLNSPLSPEAGEAHDQLFSDEADDLMNQWNGPKGQAYRQLMTFQRGLPGKFEPQAQHPQSAFFGE